MPHSRPPFQAIFFSPETHHFKLFFSSRHPTYVLLKLLHFQAQLWLNSSTWDTNFSKNLFPRPYFWKPGRRIPKNIIWVSPPLSSFFDFVSLCISVANLVLPFIYYLWNWSPLWMLHVNDSFQRLFNFVISECLCYLTKSHFLYAHIIYPSLTLAE